MSHSHLPVQHLLKQVELYRAARNNRDLRPEWLTDFIERVAEMFEPLCDDGRVGFDCQAAEERWTIGMYLGSTEIVGGPEDGQSRHTAFELDLLAVMNLFDSTGNISWATFPNGDPDGGAPTSVVTVDGTVGDSEIRLQLFAVPPADAGPGFRQYPDGRRDTV